MIVYITVKAPYGRLGETYILPEMLAIKEECEGLLILPRDRSHEFFHTNAKGLVDNVVSCPLLNLSVAKSLLKTILYRPVVFLGSLLNIVLKSRNLQIALKNLAVLPKSVYLSGIVQKKKVHHIHAHYGSTTSTMAYVISRLTGIPWSFTVHRWDIPENNLLDIKCSDASFTRAIDAKGREEVLSILGGDFDPDKIKVIHVGVNVNGSRPNSRTAQGTFTFLCPAMLVLKKGHKYLFEACRILADKGFEFKCLVAGDGPLQEELESMVNRMHLNDNIDFLGALSQEGILGLYKSGSIDLVVLPSIVTAEGEKEGIPVALMEAMSYAIPVVSTDTGSIEELLGGGNGVIVPEKDPAALAKSLEGLMKDRTYCAVIGENGKRKVGRDFNISVVSQELLSLFSTQS